MKKLHVIYKFLIFVYIYFNNFIVFREQLAAVRNKWILDVQLKF